MITDQSAATSQNTASGATPFDEILHAETRENQRAETELKAFVQEEEEVTAALEEKKKQAEVQLRDDARTELKAYKTSDLGQILNSAETEAKEEAATLESKAKQNMASTAQSLVSKVTDSDSHLFTQAA